MRSSHRPRDRRRGAGRPGMIGGIGLLLVAGFVVYQSLSAGSVTCEVCMAYKDRSQCRTVSGATEKEAMMAAILNACAYISSGVTESMACQRGEPTSAECK